jgi:hypothetical protein
MAAEKILLDIEINSSEVQAAFKNIAAGRKTIDELVESNKKLAAQGQKNSIEYIKNAEAIKALNVEVNQNSKIVQASTQANKNNSDSLVKARAENVLLRAERDKLNTSTAEGKKRTDEINAAMDKNNEFIDANSNKMEKQSHQIGDYAGQIGKLHPQLGAFAGSLGSAEKASGGLTSGLFSMVKAGLAFILTPLGLTIAGLVIGFKALQTFLFGSAQGMDLMEDAAEAVGVVMDILTDRVSKFVVGIGKILSGDFKAGLDDISGSFSGIGDEIEREVGLTLELNAAIRELEDAEIGYDIAASETGNTIKELLAQAKNRTLSEADRIKLITKAGDLEKAQTEDLKKNRAEALRIANEDLNQRIGLVREVGEEEVAFAKRLLANNLTNDEQKKSLAATIIAYNEALGGSLDFQAKLQGQADALAEKAEAEAEKRAEAEKKRLEDIAAKAAEIRAREVTAANELEILKLEKQAREIQGLDNQTDKLIEVEQERAEQLLSNVELTESERQKIIFESEEAINEILLQSREREQLEREANLTRSLEDFQEYTEGLINAEKEKYLQGIISKEEYDQQIADLDLATLETQQLIKEQFGEQDLALQGRITDYKIALGEKEVAIKKQQEEQKINAVKTGLGTIASAFNKQSVAFKVLASVQTLITTYQSAISAFNSLANIPYIGTILGIAAAAAATASGLAAVAKINSTQTPKMEEGGAMEISGPRHSAGGADVSINGRKVANVEGGEKMVILKRGANTSLLKNLSTINALAGGRDFFRDRAPQYRNADGGFLARSAATQSRGSQQRNIAQTLDNITFVVQPTELLRVEENMRRAEIMSELT